MLELSIITLFLTGIAFIIISDKDIASQLTKELISRGTIKFCGSTPYIWLGTHWQKISRKSLPILIRNMITPGDRTKVKNSHIVEAIKRISEDMNLQLDFKIAFDKQQNLLNFPNGVLNIITGEFEKDRSKYLFDYVVDGNYIPNCKASDAPTFMHFVKTSIGQENYECFLRSFGYAMSSRTDAKVAFFYTGPSDGGKSTAAKLVASTFSPELVSNVSFSQLTDEHYTIQFLGKRLNVSYDNSPKPMDHEDIFKSVTSCEEIMGRELYENPVIFRPTLKLIFASNYPFNFKHPDEAVLKRMVILPFEHSIPKNEQDPQLYEKLRKERDIIYSLAANSIKPLIESNFDFKMPNKGKDYIKSRLTELHSVEDFLTDRISFDENGAISAAVLYNNYVEWTKENALTAVDKDECKEHVLGFGPDICYRKIGPRQKRVWGYKGIRLKTAEELNAPDDNKEDEELNAPNDNKEDEELNAPDNSKED